MGEESAPECINVYEVRSMWPQTFRLGMALLQMQDEEVQMRMQDSTAAVVHRQDMLHGRQQKPAMPNEQYPIKYDELWIYENTLITDHERTMERLWTYQV